MAWFEKMEIEIFSMRIQSISREDLFRILCLSECGFTDVLKGAGRISAGVETMRNELENMKFNEGIDFILDHPGLLKAPIIINETKLMIGFNAKEIRKFTSRTYRKLEM
ncbi:negative regulator of proteolysis [Lactococcus sp. DD01]|nr:ArsC/Spx/MgsR family protein [Lactococcus sp. DD01]KXT63530.1 negative regulator of proteolysis [Lactococcus sp. DD01]